MTGGTEHHDSERALTKLARVAHQLAILSKRGPDRELLVMRDWVSSFASVVMVAARDQSLDHAPMLVFTMIAILLVIFMLRT